MLLLNCIRKRASAGGVAATGDPYWASVVLLIGAETTGSPQAFVDESPVGRALTIVNNVFPDTAQFKFGAQSARFDGNADAITAADSGDWTPGTAEPFTIEAWARFASFPTAETGCAIVSHFNSTGNQRSWSFDLINTTSPQLLRFLYSLNGSTSTQVLGDWIPSANTWYHLAVTRQADGTIMLFADGVVLTTNAGTTAALHDSSDLLRIGLINTTTPNRYWMDGWIDELRITKGVARYTGSFTPPVAAFPRG